MEKLEPDFSPSASCAETRFNAQLFALKRSPYAQRIYIESHYRAKRAEEQAINEDRAFWRNYVATYRRR